MAGEPNSNSTSVELADALFDAQIAPLAATHPQAHLDFAPRPKDGSFYVPAWRPVLEREQMARGGDGGELAELEALWAAGHPALLALIPGLRAIAAAAASERASVDDDPDAPSTLVYQMV